MSMIVLKLFLEPQDPVAWCLTNSTQVLFAYLELSMSNIKLFIFPSNLVFIAPRASHTPPQTDDSTDCPGQTF